MMTALMTTTRLPEHARADDVSSQVTRFKVCMYTPTTWWSRRCRLNLFQNTLRKYARAYFLDVS